MERFFYICAAFAGGLGVALGAFGAHALRARLTPEMLSIFETGVRYQMYHAFGLVAVAWAWARWPGRALSAAGWLFVVGIGIFSGSLYLLVFSGLRWLGAITPVGGLCLLAGWALLALGATRGRQTTP